jgi:hypothetical protein
MTDDQSTSPSWCQAPIWYPRPIFSFLFSLWQLQVSWCGAPSLTRGRVCNVLVQLLWALPEQLLLSPGPAELMAIFYCFIWDSPNLEGQVPIFISPRNRVAQLYLRALGSLFVASYDSQGYGGGILTHLHTKTSEYTQSHSICWLVSSAPTYGLTCLPSALLGKDLEFISAMIPWIG